MRVEELNKRKEEEGGDQASLSAHNSASHVITSSSGTGPSKLRCWPPFAYKYQPTSLGTDNSETQQLPRVPQRASSLSTTRIQFFSPVQNKFGFSLFVSIFYNFFKYSICRQI
jgi:hypothetical protein